MEPFERLVDEYGAAVLRLCRARLRGAAADDAWSETFLAALRAYPGLRPGSNTRAWLFTIAERKCIDELRRTRRSPVPVGRAGDDQVTDTPVEGPDDDLVAALGSLGSKQRRAVLLHHVAGLPYAEVGELIGSSEAAARRSAADGIAKLRAALGAKGRR